MKPSSLATLLLRFFAIYLLFAAILGSLGQLLISVVFSGIEASAIDNPVARFVGFQIAKEILCIIFAFVLYANSQSLGRFIAKDLE